MKRDGGMGEERHGCFEEIEEKDMEKRDSVTKERVREERIC